MEQTVSNGLAQAMRNYVSEGAFYEDQCFFFELMPFLESIDEVAVDEVCEVHYVQRNDSISYQNTSRLADLFKIYVRILNFHEERAGSKRIMMNLNIVSFATCWATSC